MIIPKDYPQATAAEIEKLKKIVKQSAPTIKFTRVNSPQPLKQDVKLNVHQLPGNDNKAEKKSRVAKFEGLFNGDIQQCNITMEPLIFDNPVELLVFLKPELIPYKWQFETLMQIAGYCKLGHYKSEDKTPVTRNNPFRLLLAAANGSGKDAVMIAAASLWFALTGVRNRSIITSSSFEQVKFQTEPALKDLINRANVKFPRLIKSIQFHHVIPALGAEIKMFATDDPGHAEGYHSWDNGGVMRIVNEAKSVDRGLFEAMAKWTGVTHDLVVSSPGKKSGVMYQRVADSISYPNDVVLGKYYFRRITAFDCPHLTAAHILSNKNDFGENSPHYRSTILAEFSDYDEPTIISEEVYEKAFLNPPATRDSDIGIGLDLAGGGDEDAGFVRRGNKVVHSFFFRQSDTELAADLIDLQLEPWKHSDYIFNADNGGIGQGIIDKLAQKGWNIRRRNNQSPAFNKREFLNLGAEVWHYIKRLIERRDIILPPNISKLKEQMTTRQWTGLETTQGKYALESKSAAKACGRPSPDRADAFNLCFFSYHPDRTVNTGVVETRKMVSIQELHILAQSGQLWKTLKPTSGHYTTLDYTNV
jgi:hypothetical protein